MFITHHSLTAKGDSDVLLTVGLSDADDQLRVEGLPQALGMHQLHGAVLEPILDVGEDGLVPRVQHELRTQKIIRTWLYC